APAAIPLSAAAAWVAASPRGATRASGPRPRAELGAVAAVALAFAIVVVVGIAENAPFSWDESAYASTTRHWLQGGPATAWGPSRPPVLSVLGALPIAFGTEEWQFRLIGLAFGLLLVTATWLLGRTVAGPVGGATAGVLSALLVAAAPSINVDAGLFLTDVPSAALIVLLLALVWRSFEAASPPGWQILGLAPLAALAFYVRYGSIVPLSLILLAVPLVWPARVVAARRQLGGTLALFGLLLLPHAVFATLQRGSPLGIVLAAQGGAAGAYPGAGLVQYLAWLPAELVGLVPGMVAVLGLVVGARQLAFVARRRAWDARGRAYALLVGPAVAHAVLLGLVALPQQRYVFLPMVLLVVAGCLALAHAASERGSAGRAAAAGMVALAWNGISMPVRAEARTAFTEWERQAGALIRRLGGGSCSVLASDYPQITWYSACPTYNFADVHRPGRERLLGGEHRFLVLRADGKFQPSGAVLDAYLGLVDPEPVAVLAHRDGHEMARIYRFATE
ncbi:MAG TPA: hypothetical protein VHK63_06640, partial [Candidatus Limnocylindria bacterium]|nr:hypothetical protein [Candidatus Limnocylindria bacterium]